MEWLGDMGRKISEPCPQVTLGRGRCRLRLVRELWAARCLDQLRSGGRANRILVLVPESLVHQWFVEMLRRFNIWLNIFGPNAKHNFDELKSKCFDRSVAEFGPEIEWDRKDTRKMSAVVVTGVGNFLDHDDRPRQFEWFKSNLEKMRDFFGPEIQRF